MASLPSAWRLRHRPRPRRRQRARLPVSTASLARGVALQRAREHAMQDRRDPEHVEDQVELPIRDAVAAGACGSTRRRTSASVGMPSAAKSTPFEPAELLRREAPGHHLVREVGQRMAERRRAPSRAPRARAARSDGRSRCRGENRRGRSRFRRPAAGAAAAIRSAGPSPGCARRRAAWYCLRPARDLPFDVVAGAAEVGKADRFVVDAVQRRDHAVRSRRNAPRARRASCPAVVGSHSTRPSTYSIR